MENRFRGFEDLRMFLDGSEDLGAPTEHESSRHVLVGIRFPRKCERFMEKVCHKPPH